jgi:DNA polymerase III delta prime subunit
MDQRKNSFIIVGAAGTGKSYYIRREAKNSGAKLFRWNVRIDRSLREGREILHRQVRSKEPLYVWIEGADDLTQEAQAFLRRILETSSANVTSMLEVREPWKLSPPIISRCILRHINNTVSYRQEKLISAAKTFKMYNKLTIPSVLTLDMIPVLRADGHDPVEILYTIAQNSSWDKKEILEVFKRLGSGHSAWIQLAYLLSADSTETKDAVI